MSRTIVPLDDFPASVLRGFHSMRKATGKGPKKIILGANAANMRSGLWEPARARGFWEWKSEAAGVIRQK